MKKIEELFAINIYGLGGKLQQIKDTDAAMSEIKILFFL